MKDLEEKDILLRTKTRLTRVSIYVDGVWRFGRLLTPTQIAENQNIYRMSVPFALVASTENNPRKGLLTGRPGDYVAADRSGELSLITVEQYNLRFPSRRKPAYKPETSEKLKGGDYITEIVRGSSPQRSNSTTTTNTRNRGTNNARPSRPSY